MLLANPVTLAVIGKPAEECIGKTDAEFLPNPEDAAPIMANDRRIMDGGRTEIYDETVINASELIGTVVIKHPIATLRARS